MKFLPDLCGIGFVVMLIGCLSFASISLLDISVSPLSSEPTMSYAQGVLVTVSPDRDFVLLTTQGMYLHFRCAIACRASLGHLQRHLREHASTDVYYEVSSQNILLAHYVD